MTECVIVGRTPPLPTPTAPTPAASIAPASITSGPRVQVGGRPDFLVSRMPESPLKTALVRKRLSLSLTPSISLPRSLSLARSLTLSLSLSPSHSLPHSPSLVLRVRESPLKTALAYLFS